MALSARTHCLCPSLCVDIHVKQSLQPREKSVAEGVLTSPIQIHVCFWRREGGGGCWILHMRRQDQAHVPEKHSWASSHRLANKKKLHTPSRRDNEARTWDKSERPLGTTLTRSILPGALPTVVFHLRLTDLSKKKLSAATDPTYPNGSERKPRTHLLTSKGMVLFARFTGGFLEKKMLQATGNHSALLSATGCSSVPGWRQLRTLCKTRLAESYILFALILFPQSSWHRFLACMRIRSKIL